MILVDVNICIYAILGGSDYLDRRLDECNAGDLAVSAVTLGELEVGFAGSADSGLARSDAAGVLSISQSCHSTPLRLGPSGVFRSRRPPGGALTTGRQPPTRSRLA